MARPSLRLRIDSPYPGESMSSFLSRAAQFYAMPAPSLFTELLHGRNWSALERRDVDLAPSPALGQRLSEVVSDWRSPAEKHRGYMRSEEHRSEFQPLMRSSYAVFCLEKNTP